ncbi:MAG: FtsX-like permease family protein [Limosilactobacillus sp.]|uniref:FtsX-like permease family protein n=1 Tax=Limosilactobacillus sp. TaxID=2773925 RepID=UPI00270CED93|nr:FtsX-like permease family protein [Limosilactobacillus sp.]
MILKLSLNGVKKQWRDYIVLFSGLVVAATIFYMFLAVTVNPEIYKDSVSLSLKLLSAVFMVGAVFLGVVTFFYLIYANTFLLNMRQKEYGMFLTLGAKRRKLVELIYSETMILGSLSTVLGIVIGIFLTKIVGNVLIKNLDLDIPTMTGFVPKAILWTILFFFVLFFIASTYNTQKLLRTSAIKLLKENDRPSKLYGQNPIVRGIQAALGIALLAVAYYQLKDFQTDNIKVRLSVIFFGILIGTVLFFHSFFTVLFNFLMSKRGMSYKKLRLFTFGQIKFRINSLTTVLSVTSIMFALALGAMSVGQQFHKLNNKVVANYYSVVLSTHSKQIDAQVKKLHVESDNEYGYKMTQTGDVYVNLGDFEKHPMYYTKVTDNGNKIENKRVTMDVIKSNRVGETLPFLMLTRYQEKKLHFVSQDQFNGVAGMESHIRYIRVHSLRQDKKTLAKIEKLVEAKDPIFQLSGYMNYKQASMMTGAFQFMGYFLSLAFLTMLASTLMFKVLSGALQDKQRYNMLYRIGADRKMMKASVRNELAVTFLVPGIMGTINVICGLYMFAKVFDNPWRDLWGQALIFWVLYAIYYIITVKIYQKIVLK